jgi:outer membrane protein assembly complex protein YaeT
MKSGSKLLRFTILVISIPVLFLAALHTPPVKKYALAKLDGYLRSNLGISLSAESLHYNLLNLSVQLQELSLRSTESGDRPPFLTARSLEAGTNLFNLLRKKPVIDNALIRDLRIQILIDEGGSDNLPHSRHSEEETGSEGIPGLLLPVLIEDLKVDNGFLLYEDKNQHFEAELPQWMLEISGDPDAWTQSIRFETADSGRLELGTHVLPVDNLQLGVELSSETMKIKEFQLSLGPSRMKVDGAVKGYASPEIESSLEATLDLGRLMRFFGFGRKAGGQVAIHTSVSGPSNKMNVTSNISGENLFFDAYKDVKLVISAGWEEGSGRIRLHSVRMDSSHGSVSGQADLALSEAQTSRASLELARLDLEPVTAYFLPIRIASLADGSVEAHWPGTQISQTDADAAMRLIRSRSRPARYVLPISGNVNAGIRGGNLSVDIRSGNVLTMGIRGKLILDSWNAVAGNIRADAGDMKPFLGDLEAFLGRSAGALIGMPVDGPLTADVQLDGTLGGIRIAGSVKAPDTGIGGIRHVDATINAGYSPEGVAFRNIEAVWERQHLTSEGEIRFGDDAAQLDLKARVEDGTLNDIVAAFGKDWSLEGRYDLDADLEGTFENIRLSTSFSISGFTLFGQKLGRLDLQASMNGEEIEVNGLELIRGPQGENDRRWTASGRYSRKSGMFEFRTDAESIPFSFNETEFFPFQAMSGRLNLTASGSGDLQNPSIVASLELQDFKIGGRKLGELDVDGELKRGSGDIAVRLPRHNVVVNADIDMESPYPTRIQVDMDTDLSALGIRLSEEKTLEGHVRAELRGAGDLARWKEGSVFFRVESLEAMPWGLKVRNRDPVLLSYENDRLYCRSLTLATDGNSQVSISGSLPLESDLSGGGMNIRGQMELSELSKLFPAPDTDTAGTLYLDGTLHGSLLHPEPDLNLAVSQGRLDHPFFRSGLEDIELDVSLAPDILSVHSLSARMGPASIRMEGTVPLDLTADRSKPDEYGKRGPARLTIDARDLRIEDFSVLPDTVSGSFGFHLEGSSPDLKDVNALNAEMTLDRVRIQTADYVLLQDGPIELSLDKSTLRLDRVSMSSPTTRLNVRGTVGLRDNQPLDVHIDGNFNIGAVTLLTDALDAEGESRFNLDVSGSLRDPKAEGFFEMDKGSFSLETPSVTATGLQVRLRVNQQSLEIEKFSGSLNGGELNIGGSTGFGASGIGDTQIDISLKNSFFNYPDGLRSRISGNMTLRTEDEFLVLGGRVQVLEGAYRRKMNVLQEMLGQLRSDKGVQLAKEENPFLSKLRFDLSVETRDGLLIDNNLAELTINADLRLTGPYYRTGLVGRIDLDEGGTLRFQERTYFVERGVVLMTNETRIEPRLDIQATTRVDTYDITLNLTGTPDDLKANLSSDPSLPQPDIISLLLTGRLLEDLQGSGLNVAREQVESYLSGQIAGFLSQNVEEAVGLSLVRIDPSLISPEANPGARLTVGDDITNSLFLIYSMNLVDAGDRILTLEYDITRNFETELTRQSDNSYRFHLGQDLRFGGLPESSGSVKAPNRMVGNVEFTGNPVFSKASLMNAFGVEPGDDYDFFEIRKKLDKLKNFYNDRGYLENRIRLEKSEEKEGNLNVQVKAGPEVEVLYPGWDPPDKLEERVRSAWSEGVFDEQRVQASIRELRRFLRGKRYFQAEIQSDVHTSSRGKKTVTFSIDTGIRFKHAVTEFRGASGILPSRLKTVLENERLVQKIHTEPEKVTDFLRKYYQQNGYLDVAVLDPRYELDPETREVKIVIPIQEGPKFRIRNLELEGNEALSDSRILEEIPLVSGGYYDPGLLKTAVDRLQKLYWTHGYNNAYVDYSLKRAENEDGALNIILRITENGQQIVDKIVIEGNREAGEDMIRSQITLKPGDVLNYEKTNESRRHLYETEAFSVVDIQSLPFVGPRRQEFANQRPVQIIVKVKEVKPFRLRYSGFYDTERGVGGIVDFSNRNSLGSARLLGTRLRYDSDVQEIRGYFSQPKLRRFPIHSDITAYFRKESVSDEDSQNFGFDTDTIGISLQQEIQFRNKFILNYGYRFEHKTQRDFGSTPQVETVQNTAPLTATLTRESRNNLLDSWKGSFASIAFEYAPSYLGSDLRFYKFLGQYFHYLPLSRPTRIPWVGETRSRLVFATGARVGFAGGLDGQDLIASNKFFAGGGTTIRGFGQNEVGPKGPEGNPIGGNSLFIINSELRFPIFNIFDGIGFLDIGNVYPKTENFDPIDTRSSAGFGLRARTPYFLFRADYGIKLDREPGETFGEFFFSIGQAF